MDVSNVRIFISSTFRDFGAERNLLVRQVFPKLRERLQQGFVDLSDVDVGGVVMDGQFDRGGIAVDLSCRD